MKNVLAVTASLKRCSIALMYRHKLMSLNEDVDSASKLVFLVDNFLKENNVDINDINGVITSSGPGSFTGIRVAHSFVKGMSLSLNIPSLSVDYFDVINSIYSKYNHNDSNVVIVIKSEKGQVYYKNHNTIGVISYDGFLNMIDADSLVIGEELPISGLLNFKVINNFRDAVHLLNFADRIDEQSVVSQLYINAQNH